MEKRALGKGLSALIPQREVAVQETMVDDKGGALKIPTSLIRANRYQPRLEFNQEKLDELISSIKEKGVIQPVLVRQIPDGYELIAGERRLRAAKSLGITEMPAIIKNVADLDMLELSLIENIQREELNPIEEASSFQKLITEFNFTQEDVAKVLGKDRSTIANTIRLLSLPKKVRDYIAKGEITTGHAKALLSLSAENDQLRVCNVIVKKGLSVRETEMLVSRRASVILKKTAAGKDQSIVDLENELRQRFGTRVLISHGKKRGRIQIEYYSTEDLNRILDMLAPKNS